MNIVGTSKVPVSMSALATLIQEVKPDGCPDITADFRLDARGNVKSTFAKFDAKKNQMNIYTGAVQTEWDAHFTNSDGVRDEKEALIFISLLAALNMYAGAKEFDMKVDSMQTLRVSDRFEQVKGALESCVARYDELAKDAPVAPVTTTKTASSGSSSIPAEGSIKVPKNQFAGQPLEEVPVLDIPSDLDV